MVGRQKWQRRAYRANQSECRSGRLAGYDAHNYLPTAQRRMDGAYDRLAVKYAVAGNQHHLVPDRRLLLATSGVVADSNARVIGSCGIDADFTSATVLAVFAHLVLAWCSGICSNAGNYVANGVQAFRQRFVMNTESVMKKALGQRWDTLPKTLQIHHSPSAHTESGVLNVSFPRWMRWYLRMVRLLFGALVDQQGENIPTHVSQKTENDKLRWERRLHFPDGEIVLFKDGSSINNLTFAKKNR